MTNGGRILYLVHDNPSPSGGIKNIYDHVLYLAKAGYPAFVVHASEGFRLPWFHRDVPVLYTGRGLEVTPQDALVIPEDFTPALLVAKGIPARKFVFCQNHFHIFAGLPKGETWRSLNIGGVIAVSDQIRSFVQWALGYADVPVIPCAIRPEIFSPEAKRLQIAVMPRKRAFEVKFIRDTFRQAFGEHREIPWVILDGASEEEVAETLRHSAVFLSMNRFEGFGLPPLEAMACGCIVVGFHGWGALDYARFDNAFWCEEENLTECVKKLGEVCTLFKRNDERLTRMRYRAMETAAGYGPERQRDTLLSFWRKVMG